MAVATNEYCMMFWDARGKWDVYIVAEKEIISWD
jgi:hypothetical protein